jgi:Ca2+-transporting ATPase
MSQQAGAAGPTIKHYFAGDGITYNKRWVANGFGHSGIQYWAIHANIPHWQTIVFTVLCFSQMGHVNSFWTRIFFKIGPFQINLFRGATPNCLLQLMIIYVPFFNVIFKTQPLSLYELILTLLVKYCFLGGRNSEMDLT